MRRRDWARGGKTRCWRVEGPVEIALLDEGIGDEVWSKRPFAWLGLHEVRS